MFFAEGFAVLVTFPALATIFRFHNGELLNLFIEKIEVGERAERYSRTSEQKVIIHYRDIGVIGAFAEEAEKIAEQRQRQIA